MKYFIDTEFLEGTQDKRILGFKTGYKTKPTIDLISIGIVSEDGREYYAISKDFNLREAWERDWVKENVLKSIFYDLHITDLGMKRQGLEKYIDFEISVDPYFSYRRFNNLIRKYGKTNKQIAEEIRKFVMFKGFIEEPPFHGYKMSKNDIEFYTYYGDYDHVALCWLFGEMTDLPEGFPMYSKDLKQMLDDKAKKIPLSYNKELGLKSIKLSDEYPKQTNEHNALADAKWNRDLYEFIVNELKA